MLLTTAVLLLKVTTKVLKKIFDMKATTLLFILASLATVANVQPYTLNFWAVWFKRPYNGPEMVVEIIGADMNRRANRFFDYWSQPDTFVHIMHGDTERNTQIEGNTYSPRFLWKTKMPYNKKMGLHFHVMEANVLHGNDVMGRAFIDTKRILQMMQTGEPGLLTVGENIGVLKIKLSFPPEDLKQRGAFSSSVKPLHALVDGEVKPTTTTPSNKSGRESNNSTGEKTKPKNVTRNASATTK